MSAPPACKFGDRLAFFDSGFVSWRIRQKTNGWCNHIAFVANPTTVWQSTFGKGLHEAQLLPLLDRNVVILRPRNSLGLDYSPSQANIDAATAFWLAENGSRYDFPAILGFLFLSYKNRWENPNGWFCEEWVDAVSDKAGIRCFNGLVDRASLSPTAGAIAANLRPIWYRLPTEIRKGMDLEGVPNALTP